MSKPSKEKAGAEIARERKWRLRIKKLAIANVVTWALLSPFLFTVALLVLWPEDHYYWNQEEGQVYTFGLIVVSIPAILASVVLAILNLVFLPRFLTNLRHRVWVTITGWLVIVLSLLLMLLSVWYLMR